MILRIITDYLLPGDKIVVSVSDTKPFCNLLGIILKRVAIKTIEGHAIYICKGSPPRPSVPLLPADMKKSPKKLGIANGKYIAIMKESGGIKERKKALAQVEKEEKMKKDDPVAYKAMERDKERIQREKNAMEKVMRDVESDDDMPLEVFCKLVAPTVVAACFTIVASEIGCWLEPRYLAKYIPILAATLCAAVPTYFGERELNRRCGEATLHLNTHSDISTNYITDAQTRWISNEFPQHEPELNLTHFIEKLIKLYEDKQGDLFDEIMEVFKLPPDLVDPELVLARSMFNIYSDNKQITTKSDDATENSADTAEPSDSEDVDIARAFVTKLVGLSDTSTDLILLCGKCRIPVNTNFTTKLSEALAIAASSYLPAEPQSPNSPKTQSEAPDSPKGSPHKSDVPGFDLVVNGKERAIAEAWEYIGKHIKCLFHFASLETKLEPGKELTLWKGMSHISLQLLEGMVKLKRGMIMGWSTFNKFGASQKPEETVLQEGYNASTANPFGGKQVNDNKGTILFKVTKTSSVIYSPNGETILSPFSQLEVSSVRPNTNVSDNSFDFDLKYTKSLFTPELVVATKNESLRVSTRVFQIIQKPIILATTVLGMATCVACIGPILEEKERIYQEMLVYGAVCTTVSATIAYQAAVDRKEKIAMMDEEEKQRKLEDEAKQKDEEEKERLRHLEEEQQRDKQAAEQALREQLVAEATAAAEEAAKLKNERQQPTQPPPQLVYSPEANSEIDWEREELEAMKRFEELFAERKKELDDYEQSRIQRTTQWEETMLVAIEKTAISRQSILDDKIKEQEERLRQLTVKAAEAEQLVKQIDTNTDMKQALHSAESDRINQQREQLKEDQNILSKNMSDVMQKIQDENLRIQKQLQQSTDQIAQRHDEYGSLLKTISDTEQQRITSAKTYVENHVSDKGANFRLTETFAPVLKWLLSIDMTRFADLFAENELSIDAVKQLSEDDLEEMGVGPLGPRTIVVNAIRKLRQGRTARTTITLPGEGISPRDTSQCVDVDDVMEQSDLFNVKKILTDFYLKYDSGKVCQINEITHKFEGQTERLFATLASIYPIYFPSPYRDRTVSLLKSISPPLVPAVDILLDLHQDREIELLGDLLRVSDGLPLSLSPSNTRASHIGRRREYEIQSRVSSYLQSQNNPNPEAVAGLLTATFSSNPDVLLRAFKEVEMGVKPHV